MDFFTVSTLTGRVLFVLVLMAHDRRRIVHVNVTEHPTSAWTAQQLVEAFPEDSAPRWLLRARDSIYDDLAPTTCGRSFGEPQAKKGHTEPARICAAAVSY